jgi:aminopeptidase N
MNYLSLLTVHETAHQWWFGLVASDQAIEPWLDEALATYSEYLFLEEFYPELTDWWWDFRVDSFTPTGNPGSTIYEFTEVRPYINAVYLHGAHFIRDLRNTLSDEVFFNRFKTYAVDNQYLISDGEGFMKIFIPDMTVEETILLEKYFGQ